MFGFRRDSIQICIQSEFAFTAKPIKRTNNASPGGWPGCSSHRWVEPHLQPRKRPATHLHLQLTSGVESAGVGKQLISGVGSEEDIYIAIIYYYYYILLRTYIIIDDEGVVSRKQV